VITTEVFNIESEQCLKLKINKVSESIQGTEILIKGYVGETYEERFIDPQHLPDSVVFY
jgi:hypothetical protein